MTASKQAVKLPVGVAPAKPPVKGRAQDRGRIAGANRLKEIADPDNDRERGLQEVLQTPLADLSKDDLLRVARQQQQYMATLMSGTPYSKQRVAANFLSAKVLDNLMGPHGDGGEGSLLEIYLKAARGYEHVAYCPTPPARCDLSGKALMCPQCKETGRIMGHPNYKAADALLRYVVPAAQVSDESLQQEFVESVFRIALEEFDAANEEPTPQQRKATFGAALRARLAGGAL